MKSTSDNNGFMADTAHPSSSADAADSSAFLGKGSSVASNTTPAKSVLNQNLINETIKDKNLD